MNKLTNNALLIIAAILLAIFYGNKYFGSSKDRNFETVLVAVDTTSITKIEIIGKSNDFIPISVFRNGSDWEVSDGIITDKVPTQIVKGILTSLVSIEPSRLIATDKSKWETNEITDSLGAQVKVYSDSNLLTDFVIGKFNFNQATRSMSTSIRLSGSENVYTVQGYLASTFNRKTDDFRDKSFIKTPNSDDLTKITFNYAGDSSFVMTNSANGWQIDGIVADTVIVNKFLAGITNLSMNEFDDVFEPGSHQKPYEITIDGNNLNSIIISGYSTDDGLVLNSSLNKNAYFKQGTFKPFEKLFIQKQNFFIQKLD